MRSKPKNPASNMPHRPHIDQQPQRQVVKSLCLLQRPLSRTWRHFPHLNGQLGPIPRRKPEARDRASGEYARRGDAVGGGPAARALASRSPRQSRPARRRAFRRHPSYLAFIAPDGSPYDAANVVTANG